MSQSSDWCNWKLRIISPIHTNNHSAAKSPLSIRPIECINCYLAIILHHLNFLFQYGIVLFSFSSSLSSALQFNFVYYNSLSTIKGKRTHLNRYCVKSTFIHLSHILISPNLTLWILFLLNCASHTRKSQKNRLHFQKY